MPHEKRMKIRVDRNAQFAAVCGKGGLEIWNLANGMLEKMPLEGNQRFWAFLGGNVIRINVFVCLFEMYPIAHYVA